MTEPSLGSSRFAQIPRGIWALGFVSMFMDLSSEMIHSLLPIYLVSVLGTSALTVGFIEGFAEATGSILKIFSGALSDRIGKRKLLAVIGYGLSALAKPIFPLANTVGWVVAARFVDRVGKGIRGAPRDALVSDIAPAHLRGACFGLRQSMDTIGAFLGPLAAIFLMTLSSDNFRLVFWIAVTPALVAVSLMIFAVEEPARHKAASKPIFRPRNLRLLPRPFWIAVCVAAVLTLARFSEAFLLLRSRSVGIPIGLAPGVLVVMNVFYAGAAYPAGALSDRLGRRSVLGVGVALLVAADLFLAFGSIPLVTIGVALWGLHMGFTQGLLATMVADAAPTELRGTAFGVLNLAVGFSLLIASVVAGAIWDLYGPAATFLEGAGFATIALVGFFVLRNAETQREGEIASK